MKHRTVDKCGSCRRIIPNHLKAITCLSCGIYCHIKCSNISSVRNCSTPIWQCSTCFAKELPFFGIPDSILKETYEVNNPMRISNDLNMGLQASFNVQRLLREIPGQLVRFDELSNCKNSSKYYSINQFNKLRIDQASSLGFLHANLASLSAHQEELSILLSLLNYNFKVIAISETRIKEAFGPTGNVDLNNYFFVDTKTKTNAGGVGFYIHNSLQSDVKIRHDLCFQSANEVEAIFIEIHQKGRKNIICGCIYKHPNMKVANFMEVYMLKTLNTLANEDKFINIMGDFNINLLNYDHCADTCEFYDNISSNLFQAQILQPTRVTLRSQTLIDNIFTNNIKYESVSGNLTCHVSDHFLQFTIFTDYCLKTKRSNSLKFGRSYKNFRDNEFLEEVARINWTSSLADNTSVDSLLNKFLDNITDVLNVMAPVHRLTKRELNLQAKPWITRGLLKAMSKRDRLYRKFLKENNCDLKSQTFTLYKKYRNLIVLLLKRKSKILYYRDYFQKNSCDIKKNMGWNQVYHSTLKEKPFQG